MTMTSPSLPHLDADPKEYCASCGEEINETRKAAKYNGESKPICVPCLGYDPETGHIRRGPGTPIVHWNEVKKVHRNDPCPCGSEKKYKHCCININRK